MEWSARVDSTSVQLERLLRLRQELKALREEAISPAIASSLQTADVYLFLALGYLGYSEELFPEQTASDAEGRE